MKVLAKAAQTAQALSNDVQKQQRLLEQHLAGLQKSVLLASAPDGMALTSGQHLQMSASDNLIATAGGSVDFGAMKDVRVAAAEAVSLFALNSGMKLIAAKQDLIAQAQSGQLLLSAAKDAKLTSTDGQMTIASKQGMTLTSGGAYIKLSNGSIELGCPGDITLKCGNFHWDGPASLPDSEYPWPGQIPMAFSTRMALDKQLEEWIGTPSAIPYQFVDQSGTVVARGVLDEHGMTQRIYHKDTESLSVLLGDKGEWSVTEHDDSGCGCGGVHEADVMPGFLSLISQDSREDSSDATAEGGNGSAESRPEDPVPVAEADSDGARQDLLEQLVFNDRAVQQAIANGEE